MKRTARQRRIENQREGERIARFYNPIRSSPMFDSIEIVKEPSAPLENNVTPAGPQTLNPTHPTGGTK